MLFYMSHLISIFLSFNLFKEMFSLITFLPRKASRFIEEYFNLYKKSTFTYL